MADSDLQNLSVPKFYAGRHIFITGGSGFLGKVLVEKILRSCPDIAGIHLLLREKKGVPPADRLNSITQVALFDVLRKQNPNFAEKMFVVNGDIALPGLGLCPEIREFLVKNVSVVFHGAATVRFDVPLVETIAHNVRATLDVALLAKEMANLAVFVHISTTYCNTDRKVIEEKLYPPHADWRILLKATEKLDSRTLELITPKLRNALPNTYTFTKSLAEHCVNDVLQGKSLIIVRPSVVIPTMSEPVKGWIDNFNGPAGILVACGKGLMHISLTPANNKVDYIPVDIVIKTLLIAAFKHGSTKTVGKIPPVYNCACAELKEVTNGLVRKLAKEANVVFPFNEMIWFPCGFMTGNRFIYLLGTLVFHMIPALFLDAMLRLKGEKPRIAKIQRNIYRSTVCLEPFLLSSWKFKNEEAFALNRVIPAEDVSAFSFDNFIDEDYFEIVRWCVVGGRRYLLYESDETLPAARLHRRRLILIKTAVSCLGAILLALCVFLFLLPGLVTFIHDTINIPLTL